MPKPIVCLSAELRQFLVIFRPCFSKRQWKYFVIVLLGLIECEERRTMTGLLRVVGERVSLSGLSRFLNKWSWSPEEVTRLWLQHFRERMRLLVQAEHQRLRGEQPKSLGRPKTTVVTGYVMFDDSVHVKAKGRKMAGLGQHYSSTERRVVNGHSLFAGLYLLLDQRCPLPMAMYRQQTVCRREGVPFVSKIDLAVQYIEQFEVVPDTQTHLLLDSWYHCKRVRHAAQARGWNVSGGLKSNRVMCLTTTDGRREWLKLSQYLTQLTAADWQPVSWPSGQGGQTMYAHLAKTWIRKLGPTLLLITCHSLSEPLNQVRYWGSTAMNLEAQDLVNTLAKRWEIETFFECDKDLLGSDHYQVMTTQAIIRFWTLTACLLCFLEEQRAMSREQMLTCGDVRHRIQAQHRRNLLHWLQTQFQAGLTVEQIGLQLALSSS